MQAISNTPAIINTDIINTDAEFQAIRDNWNKLWQQAQAPIGLQWDWIAAVHAAHGTNRQHFHAVVRQNDEVAGIFPAALEDGKLIGAGMPRADSMDLLCTESDKASVAVEILKAFADAP
ncbi:MAG: hypothetical protein CMJ78_22880 [Planctomycetaceae bacterium]|nr:hypothetical protein [Planctomycetaceae bacterium]